MTAGRALPLFLVPFAFDVVILFLNPQFLTPSNPSVEFTLPMPFPSLSQVQGQTSASPPFFPLYPPPALGQLSAPVLLLILGVQSYVAAGYLATLEMVRRGDTSRRFLGGANYLFSRIFAFNALIAVFLLLLEPFLRGYEQGPFTSLFILSALLILLYFLFLTPFIVVVDDLSLGDALRQSMQLALQSRQEVLPYCLAYAAITLLASAAVILLLPLPMVGTLISAGLYSLLGTALVASTLHLYDELRPKEAVAAKVPSPRPAEEAAPAT